MDICPDSNAVFLQKNEIIPLIAQERAKWRVHSVFNFISSNMKKIIGRYLRNILTKKYGIKGLIAFIAAKWIITLVIGYVMIG
jgi:hypothetical protein